ncbi:two-component sensor histidine kinase [Staphylococcus petrasii]|uniref:HAMP domain-containing sensor histidine kinase n=1 Tax=Staphylococcus petrasii TaxID=1276936 RepID=UPI000CD22DE8|nr:HAMP domain-containing sensor histidine kinase [Staphylococcus petrasii]PNZ83920.1 two-component sensor histidine kinase [Staphylococcus petrasii]TGA81700.1 HAMP domain-containing histidine kinase [Staphylococcus petrasii]SUM59193.1 sensor kinase [Staphylococcus petrasii]
MNKRFTLKFLKYISIFLIINFIFSMVFVVSIFLNIVFNFSGSMNELDTDYLDMFNITNQPNEKIKNLAKQDHVDLYFTNKQGEITYPESLKGHSIKPFILSDIRSANSIKTSNGQNYLVYIYKHNNNDNIKNSNNISTSQLLESITTQDYNKYNYNISNNTLTFSKNLNYREYDASKDLSTSGHDMNKAFFKILIIFLVINIFFVSITAFLISKRLTKPLAYYIDWIGNLSEGKLYQPTSKQKRKRKRKRKKRKTYPELDHSLTQLNQQMLSDKFYHNQINYYKTKWINQISHDLKSPLTTIYGYSKLIQTDEASQPYVQLISEKATFMSDLIDSLNQSFDLETQQMKQDKENSPIKATVERIASIIGYQQLSLSFNLGEESQFYGNKLYFERLLINLINNSIEHNDKHPNITIHFTRENNILIIDYIDDGQGLPQSNIDDLIKQSYTSKKDNAHHSMGLSIIQDAVHFHDGSIEVLPTDTGVHFHISLVDKS